MSLDPRVKTIFVSFISFDLSNMSLDLSSTSFYLSSMSFYLSSMSLDLSSMSFVDDPLSQSSLWGSMKHFLSALKNLLVGNLKNFILLIHDCSVARFVALDTTLWHTGIETRNTMWDRLHTGIETQRGTGFKPESRPETQRGTGWLGASNGNPTGNVDQPTPPADVDSYRNRDPKHNVGL
ncbi:hypothetical protein TNCV_1397421 [Trichonephila clavipes]|nr:hypothetical protein TNCV_1397421 [Trichonephila clavipes]